ncbi:Uncharacterised protein [Moraxella ovis]|uniref:Uncharacterized protein n=1 Tax=Moraxella ovis TaxID=29433 RepID=A0A378PQC5_9GAMM|nr:Uncharacterised protein [Moraxella ovis]
MCAIRSILDDGFGTKLQSWIMIITFSFADQIILSKGNVCKSCIADASRSNHS